MIDFLINYCYHSHIIIATDTSFQDAIQTINAMPKFFEDAMNWGLSASYETIGFMSILALGMALFKR